MKTTTVDWQHVSARRLARAGLADDAAPAAARGTAAALAAADL